MFLDNQNNSLGYNNTIVVLLPVYLEQFVASLNGLHGGLVAPQLSRMYTAPHRPQPVLSESTTINTVCYLLLSHR